MIHTHCIYIYYRWTSSTSSVEIVSVTMTRVALGTLQEPKSTSFTGFADTLQDALGTLDEARTIRTTQTIRTTRTARRNPDPNPAPSFAGPRQPP